MDPRAERHPGHRTDQRAMSDGHSEISEALFRRAEYVRASMRDSIQEFRLIQQAIADGRLGVYDWPSRIE